VIIEVRLSSLEPTHYNLAINFKDPGKKYLFPGCFRPYNQGLLADRDSFDFIAQFSEVAVIQLYDAKSHFKTNSN